MNMSSDNRVGRPTSEVAAMRSWQAVPNEIRKKVPTLLRLSMDRLQDILENEKSSESAILRAHEAASKLYKELRELEIKELAALNGTSEAPETEEEEQVAVISLVASN